MSLKRYKLAWEIAGRPNGDCGWMGPMELEPSGDWVRLSDVFYLLERLPRYEDNCGDNSGGDCGLCDNDKEDPEGYWIKFEELEKILN
jgi:hypothetical protein